AYLPDQRANAVLDQRNLGLQVIPGKVRPLSRHLAEAHPQILIIAPAPAASHQVSNDCKRQGAGFGGHDPPLGSAAELRSGINAYDSAFRVRRPRRASISEDYRMAREAL